MVFCLEAGYWLSNKGVLCLSQSASPVTDRNECIVAVTSLLAQYPSALTYPIENTMSHSPKGCYVLAESASTNQFWFYWNQHSTGRANAAAWQICKSNGK